MNEDLDLLDHVRPRTVAVLGDLILDQYTFGSVQRISPEAPVPVVEMGRTEFRPGGSGNVLLNLGSLGMRCLSFGRVGRDAEGERLAGILAGQGLDTSRLLVSGEVPTTLKNRVVAQHQQILRLDRETVRPLSPLEERRVLDDLVDALPEVDALVCSDYGKGFLTDGLLAGALAEARKRGVPSVVDPKSSDFRRYRGATVITPNRKEALAAAPLAAGLEEAARHLLEAAGLDFLLITLSEDGIALFEPGPGGLAERRFPVRVQEVLDVTGAGDTVVAVLASCLANRLPRDFACRLSNVAAGFVVGHFGAATVDLATLRRILRDGHPD